MGFQELSHAFRRFRREPVFVAGVVTLLALALGANIAIFTLVDAVLIRPLPLRDPDRLVSLAIVRPGNDQHPLSLPDLADFQASARTLEAVASAFAWSANVTGVGQAERLQGVKVSADYFAVTGATSQVGRAILPEDAERRVALLSHGLWQRRFGGAADAVGRSLVINGDTFTIVGVLRPDFLSIVRDPDLVVPYSPASDPRRGNRAQGFLRVVARLRDGVTLAQAVGELEAIGRRMRSAYPDSHGTDTGMRVVPLHEAVSGRVAPMLHILLAAVFFVLLVACANLASLFLLRGLGRRRELALRSALGASRARLAGQLLIEAFLLGAAGMTLGLMVARALVGALLAAGPANMPRLAEVGINLRVAAFAVVLSSAAVVLFGLVPGLLASRGDVRDGLTDGGRAADAGTRLRAWLVAGEVALSTMLLISAALLARSFERVQAVDSGFRPANVLTVRLSLPRARYQDATAIQNFYEALQPRLAALPGIRAVAAANVVPMNNYLATTAFYIAGVTIKDAPEVHYRMISPDYFRALGITLRGGRAFTATDRAGTQPVVIVNERFVRHYLGGRDPIGARVRLDDGKESPRLVEVVGVVADVRHFGLESEPVIEAYVPIAQVPDQTTIWLANNMYWVIQTDGDPLGAANAVRREVAEVDSDVPASFARSMDQWMSAGLEARRFNLALVEAFAAAALLLALVGVYATSASALASRKREIGIRTALGASRRSVVSLVLRGGLAPVLLGVACGTVAALLSGGALAGLLFGVSPHDPRSLVTVILTLVLAAFAASYAPARRAAKVDPMIALRTE
jgi:putative ABC transport system permease protein